MQNMSSFRPHEFFSLHAPLAKQPEHGEHRVDHTPDLHTISAREVEHSPSSNQLAALSRRLSQARTRRAAFVAPSLFGEPGWDMLLALYNAERDGYRMTVSRLCEASGGPTTTAVRWLATLGQLRMVRRVKNPLDARVVFIQLQPEARLAINAYLRDIWTSLFATDELRQAPHANCLELRSADALGVSALGLGVY